MISALCWVPKGAAKAMPDVAEPTPEELEAMRSQAEQAALENAGNDLDESDNASDDEHSEQQMDSSDEAEDDAETAVKRARAVAASLQTDAAGPSSSTAATSGIEAALAELDMDNYDAEEDENVMTRLLAAGAGNVYQGEDPHITLEADSDSEIEDHMIKPEDLLLLAAKNEDDVSMLEVWLYEEAGADGEGNIYVHHDLLLPAFPLSLAWMNCDPKGQRESANMVAVGTMEPGIEIWDLDVIDAVEPVAVLGGEDAAASSSAAAAGEEGEAADKKKKKKSKSKKKRVLREGSHEDAVLGLAWNRQYRNVLASASADSTVKVWDVAQQRCEHTLRHHSSKVQAVAWNPVESPVLLTGAFDKTACLVDVRAAGGEPLRWQLSADVEALAWNPQTPTSFLVSSEDGIVACYDARAGAAPLFRLAAHDKPTCTMSFCAAAPGLLATGSTDKKVKLWDISGNQPQLLATEDLKVGAVFAAAFAIDTPHVLAAAGAKGEVAVWDLRGCAAVMARYPQLAGQQAQQQEQEAQ